MNQMSRVIPQNDQEEVCQLVVKTISQKEAVW